MIWAIGRNYLDHAKEMGSEKPEKPLVFSKAPTCQLPGNKLILPAFSSEVHHEIEVAILLNEELEPAKVALAIDLTARDIQSDAKAKGHPWTLAKSFRHSCPISPWIDYEDKEWFSKINFQLEINGRMAQKGRTADMIFKLSDLLTYLKKYLPLAKGDVILTGTPAGVGKLNPGDSLEAKLNDEIHWSLTCVAEQA